MQPVKRVDIVLEQIQRARAKRIHEAAGHAAIGGAVRLELRVARHHLVRWRPFRPMLLPLDDGIARPFETGAAKPDAIANRHAVVAHEIEVMAGRIDHDGAGSGAGRVGNDLAQELRIDFLIGDCRQAEAVIRHRAVHRGIVFERRECRRRNGLGRIGNGRTLRGAGSERRRCSQRAGRGQEAPPRHQPDIENIFPHRSS